MRANNETGIRREMVSVEKGPDDRRNRDGNGAHRAPLQGMRPEANGLWDGFSVRWGRRFAPEYWDDMEVVPPAGG
jgi:hypothetical protein